MPPPLQPTPQPPLGRILPRRLSLPACTSTRARRRRQFVRCPCHRPTSAGHAWTGRGTEEPMWKTNKGRQRPSPDCSHGAEKLGGRQNKVFERVLVRNVVSSTSMLSGCLQNGFAQEGRVMRRGHLLPSEHTMASVLTACTMLGSLHERTSRTTDSNRLPN